MKRTIIITLTLAALFVTGCCLYPLTGQDWLSHYRQNRDARAQAIRNGWDDGHNPNTIVRCEKPSSPTPDTALTMRRCWQRNGEQVYVVMPGPALIARPKP